MQTGGAYARAFYMHCHLLCGVDDGPKEMKETLTLLYQAYDEWPAVLTRTSCGDIISLMFAF
jgi:hypothetical protein